MTADAPPAPAPLRIGSSLCARRLPTGAEVHAAAEEAERTDRVLELVTPPAHARELDRILPLLAVLTPCLDRSVAVVNDLGVLQMIREEYPSLPMVAGRLLNHQMKDPRLVEVDRSRLGRWPPGWELGSATSPRWRARMGELGVVGAELDWPAHGLDQGAWAATGIPLTLHLPWVVVAWGRTCVARDPRGPVDRAIRGEDCDRGCLDGDLELRGHGPGRRIRRGTAELLRLPDATHARARRWAARAGIRVHWNDPEGAA